LAEVKEMKKLSYFVAGLLLFSSFAAIVIGKEAGELENGTISVPDGTERVFFEIEKLGKSPRTTGLAGNVLVSIGSPEDDYLPGITKDSSGNVVVAWTQDINILTQEMAWGVSQDNGETWEASATTGGGYNLCNDIAWVNGPVYIGLFGVYIHPMEDERGFYLFRDATDFESMEFSVWTSEAPDLTYACISDNSYLEGQYHELDGPANAYIQHLIYLDYDIPGCYEQMITGFTPEGEVDGGEGTFDGQADLDTAPGYDPDMSNEYMKSHHTWYCDPNEDGNYKIVWKKIVPIEGDTDSTDIEYTPYQRYLGDGTNPAIAHFESNVAVVYMNDGNVKCAYSSDDGENWNTVTLGPGTYPDICAGSAFQCAYVNEGDLYITESKDGGATWGTPGRINDVDGTVVEEENAVDIHSAGVVWTDNRDGDKNIYYSPAGNAPFKPSTPDGPTSGKTGRAHTYSTSTSDPNGDDVSYGWDWDGDDVVDEWTDFNPSGTPVSTSHTWDADFTGEIKVKAKDTNDDESTWSSPLSVSIPKNKAVTYPLLQKFLEIFPNAFPLLRYIIGL